MAALAGADVFRRLQDQFIDPVKSCLAARFGGAARSGGKLRLTPGGAEFFSTDGELTIELTSPKQDGAKLNALLHRDNLGDKPELQIEIDPRLVMSRQVRLPSAAKRNLVDVLGYEMDRLSPFEADQVYYHFTPQTEQQGTEWLAGELTVVQKQRLDPWYRMLSELGLAIGRVSLVGESLPMMLKPRQSGVTRSGGSAAMLLWAAVLLLSVVTAGGVVWQQRQIAIDLQHKMQAAREQAAQSMRLEEQLTARRKAIGMVSAQRQDYLAVSDILLELTRLIPDGSWLQRVNLNSDSLIVSGVSDQASALIARLEASPMFVSVRFKSPVVRDRRSGKEKFDLTMDLIQGPES
ncbi:MAG: PilN domain-containing protein [Candidatus Thiodiazotropha lotti]|uniref:Fimbrial assembly protein n=1 Tax=Candidatus Thiodiazotropha endoloripes TaxID=1818881 RepID=A0A1E2UN34_9GAMM|nr:PilN domain-containing protein [Candidatus Thiodiazotropha endoloripes]MCG7899259.1 PilN domain-containing protein [Candidatus Thiodiazotropha weberae]MCG7991356.1 PilN domain-containing protein [Candidatus Thiodiazotropha lotti]MCG7902866.1 PilN domain-containing protein [Candidatus Thiodiazotropha weberae]MCG7912547.1 PilN domain-containing protein [Candidatus Thiodiazotropha weberae]MCG8001068.1 PilN domain-containing protein [Candidatus Thiodiazotropha lotti]